MDHNIIIRFNAQAEMIYVFGAEFGYKCGGIRVRAVGLGYSDSCGDNYQFFYQSVETVILHGMYSKAKT